VASRLRLIGLTGGIGSGKSTVARLIEELGFPVLDADQLAREAVAPGRPAHAEIARLWPEVIASSGAENGAPDAGARGQPGGARGGQIDRRRLGAIVFADPAARTRLEAIVHPRIQELARARAAALAEAGHRLAFYEASLLVETGRQRDLDGLVVVTAAPETQLHRAMTRDGLSRAEAAARIAAQLPLAAKVAAATHVIDNDGDLAATRRQVRRLVDELARAADQGTS
jgi:dephospho-CoA kinase